LPAREVQMATLHLLPGGAAPARLAERRAGPARVAGRPSARVAPGRAADRAARPGAVVARPVTVAARPVLARPAGSSAMVIRPTPPLRLTRRGRVVVRLLGALVLAGLVAVGVLGLVRPALAGIRSRPLSLRYHVVLPGETLLQIAAEAVPGVDARDTAIRILQLNALSGSGLQAGQRLALPARD
ncbi:MAG TPA: LysM peptidoglycan-binding domain-containing protein, partial [Kineosporiaceae bacterium]